MVHAWTYLLRAPSLNLMEFFSLLNVLLGQAKMAVYGTRKCKIERNMSKNLLPFFFFNSVKSRILIDSRYFKAIDYLLSFELIRCYGGAFV